MFKINHFLSILKEIRDKKEDIKSHVKEIEELLAELNQLKCKINGLKQEAKTKDIKKLLKGVLKNVGR